MNDQEFNLLLGDLDRLCATCIAPFTVMLAIADTANLTPQGIIAENRGGVICLNDTQLPGNMLACASLSGSVAEGSV